MNSLTHIVVSYVLFRYTNICNELNALILFWVFLFNIMQRTFKGQNYSSYSPSESCLKLVDCIF